MDPPLVSESSFLMANPSSYTLADILNLKLPSNPNLRIASFPGFSASALFNQDASLDESTVTDQSGSLGLPVGSVKRTATPPLEDDFSKNNASSCKRTKVLGSSDVNVCPKVEAEECSGTGGKPAEQVSKPVEPPKDYIHVRARRGQATDSHSLAERARREKISERMKILQNLVPGCNRVIGKALVLDEIINYIQSLQHQVEFLSMKLEAVNSTMNSPVEGFHPKDLTLPMFGHDGMLSGPQAQKEYDQGSEREWLHMQLGNDFDRGT